MMARQGGPGAAPGLREFCDGDDMWRGGELHAKHAELHQQPVDLRRPDGSQFSAAASGSDSVERGDFGHLVRV